MATTKRKVQVGCGDCDDYEDTIRDIYDNVQEAGRTRAEMSSALETIADLCTDSVPDLEAEDENDEEAEAE